MKNREMCCQNYFYLVRVLLLTQLYKIVNDKNMISNKLLLPIYLITKWYWQNKEYAKIHNKF